MSITEKTMVSEVARSFPASIPVFREYGIDFCCGGSKPLSEVCREKGVSVGRFLEKVEQVRQSPEGAPARDWSSASLAELIDHILEKHHAYLRTELPRLAELLAGVLERHGEKHPESLPPLGKIYGGLKRELEDHMWKEENILFPFIKQMEGAPAVGGAMAPRGMSVGNPITVMEQEHESAANALRQMRQVTTDYRLPEDGCTTYRELLKGLQVLEGDLHEHIYLENNILFPRAIELENSLTAR